MSNLVLDADSGYAGAIGADFAPKGTSGDAFRLTAKTRHHLRSDIAVHVWRSRAPESWAAVRPICT